MKLAIAVATCLAWGGYVQALHIPLADHVALAGSGASARASSSLSSTTSSTESATTASSMIAAPHINAAIDIVKKAQIQMAKDNTYRVNHPRCNVYSYRPKPVPAPTVVTAVSAQVATAAAVVAEFNAENTPLSPPSSLPTWPSGDGTVHDDLEKRQASGFWMESITHSGFVPIGGTAGYKVFRNVKDYGAKGDGVTDDTAAINKAISDGSRCGEGCGSSTVSPALVYFPSGKYLVSSPIISYYNTQLVGNPLNRPLIRASSSFVGLGVITSDVYIPGGSGSEWYINQNNFLRQVRNFDIDIRSIPNVMPGLELAVNPAGIHWQVAQATSLQNINIYMSTRVDTSHYGIFMENGSGGFFSNMTFNGGKVGVFMGNQQFTIRSLTFNNCQTAVQMLWDWGFTMKDITINGGNTGFNITGGGGGQGASYSQGIGSLMLIDSSISGCKTGILMTYNQVNTTQLNLDNVNFSGVGAAVQRDSGDVLLSGGTAVSWGSGTLYDDPATERGRTQYGAGINPAPKKPDSLIKDGKWLQRDKPQYENIGAGSFWDVRAKSGARGNGRNDDTAAINQALKDATAVNAIVYFPHGMYIVTDTIFVPNGARIVGEIWPQIMASGPKFSDINNPHVMFQVGKEGDVGVVEIQDMLFTTRGNTAGAILVQWNIKQSSPGSAAMWEDSHIRVGGAVGSNLQNSQCPKLTGSINPNCIAASLLIHLTTKSSGYFENVWAWTADHDMDLVTQDQIDVFAGRGWLIESQGPTWLYGTASEHNVLYQYQLSGAKDIFLGMIQTESPYYQGTTTVPAPKPFDKSPGIFWNDPDFRYCYGRGDCMMSWGLRILSSTSIYLYGAGLYTWFSAYAQQPCLGAENCQLKMVDIDDASSSNVWVYNLITKGVQSMMTPYISRSVRRNDNQNGFTSTIMAWLVLGHDKVPSLTNWAFNFNQHPMQ